MDTRPLGQTGLSVTPIGFGAFKIGRNAGIKYPSGYDLPSDDASAALLHAVLDMGISYIDTAPAYGLSEQRIGAALADRRNEYVLSTKVGERFLDGESRYNFGADAVRDSVESSLRTLRTDVIDIVYIHAHGDDRAIVEDTGACEALDELKAQGKVRAVGFSGKTDAGFRAAWDWADVFMVEYSPGNEAHHDLIAEAGEAGLGVVVKKALGSGHLPADDALRFVLEHPHVDSAVVGSLNANHLRANCTIAQEKK